jgi:hypothetical protein
LTGCFQSPTINFGSFTLNASAEDNIFLAKYDANGNVLWAKSPVGTMDDQGRSVAVDATGNIYLAGTYCHNITFGVTTLTNAGGNTPDLFLAKYDANGNVLWAKSAGGAEWDEVTSVAVDVAGNSYVTGYFQSPTIYFGSNTLTNASSARDIFLAKYDANGNVLWAKRAGSNDSDGASSVAVDVSGNTYVTGYFQGTTITFGSTTLTNANANNTHDMFLAKYDVNGNVIWAKSAAGGTDSDYAESVAIDASGNTYMSGWFYSTTLNFGSITLTNDGGQDIFIVKYDSNGNALWVKGSNGSGGDFRAYSGAVDGTGCSYVAGLNVEVVTFGSTTLIGGDGGTYHMFIAKLSATAGISESNNSSNITVFPNPANCNFTITIPPTTSQISILSSLGQIIQRTFVDKQTSFNFDIWENGIYFIQIISDKKIITKKIIVCK